MQKDFNTFSDIQHMPLRVFNRAVFTLNLQQDMGEVGVEEYLDLFTQPEKAQMYAMITYIKKRGPEAARALATKDLVLEEGVAIV